MRYLSAGVYGNVANFLGAQLISEGPGFYLYFVTIECVCGGGGGDHPSRILSLPFELVGYLEVYDAPNVATRSIFQTFRILPTHFACPIPVATFREEQCALIYLS